MADVVIKLLGQEVGGWVVNNVGWTFLIILFGLSIFFKIFNYFFKITKKEIDPLGWFIGLIGKPLTKAVRSDIANVYSEISTLKADNEAQFKKIVSDRANSIKDLKADYNKQITDLKSDIDSFEKNTNVSLEEMKKGTTENCKVLQKRLDAMEKSNDLQSIRQIRAHVLDFANSCLNGRKHTVKDFDNIFDENGEYEKLCKKYKIKNHKYKEDYEFIVKQYHKCQDENSFLKESDIN